MIKGKGAYGDGEGGLWERENVDDCHREIIMEGEERNINLLMGWDGTGENNMKKSTFCKWKRVTWTGVGWG